MKLISLNVWGGKRMGPLKDFIGRHTDADIFCFQEVYHEASEKDSIWKHMGPNFNFLNDVKKFMLDYDCYYRPHLGDWWGLAIFVKKASAGQAGISVLDEGEHYVHKFNGHDPEREPHGYTAKNIQFMRIVRTENGENTGSQITVLNFHGLWNGNGKNDSEDRLIQSRKIIDFIKTLKTDYIFCGDFNLNPDTESLAMIARELGCRDLIAEYGITSTRTSLYPKPNKFADYIFISKGIDVIDFKILPDVVSDHAPMLIEV